MNFPDLKVIKQKRRALNLPQKALAKRAGISQSMLAKIETGEAVPSYKIAGNIFESLEMLENSNSKKAKDVMNSNVISLGKEDSIGKAISLAKKHSVSQFPIVQDGFLVGSISTRELMGVRKDAKIGAITGVSLPTVNENTPAETVRMLLKSSQAVWVVVNGKPVGVITAEDLL